MCGDSGRRYHHRSQEGWKHLSNRDKWTPISMAIAVKFLFVITSHSTAVSGPRRGHLAAAIQAPRVLASSGRAIP